MHGQTLVALARYRAGESSRPEMVLSFYPLRDVTAKMNYIFSRTSTSFSFTSPSGKVRTKCTNFSKCVFAVERRRTVPCTESVIVEFPSKFVLVAASAGNFLLVIKTDTSC